MKQTRKYTFYIWAKLESCMGMSHVVEARLSHETLLYVYVIQEGVAPSNQDRNRCKAVQHPVEAAFCESKLIAQVMGTTHGVTESLDLPSI